MEVLFYIFTGVILLSALMVVVSRNAVNSALFMILSFVGTAGLFALLDAYFLAILQILIYAGAVMVLFLFVIMLINVEKVAHRRPSLVTSVVGGVGIVALCMLVGYLFLSGHVPENLPFPGLENRTYETSPKMIGYGLFTQYLLPFEIVGFLLLIAMMGVVVISKGVKVNHREFKKR